MNALMALGAIALCGLTVPQSFDRNPTDDVWVYPHAADQDTDPFLRVWGNGGKAVAAKGEATDSLAYSYLKFDLSGLPKDKKLVEATLVLTHVASPSWTAADAKAGPFEVRAMQGTFTEKTWTYEKLVDIRPLDDSKSIFASVTPSLPAKETAEFPVSLNLLSGPGGFAERFKAAIPLGSISMALTSPMDPEANDGRTIYKLYSTNAEKTQRPVLRLKFE